VQRDGRGPTSTTQLRSQLQAVRQRGHAVEDGLVTPGLGSVAVAVLDHNDYPVAGIAVTYPQDAVDDEATARLVEAVARAASSLSTRLGRATSRPLVRE